MLNWVHRQKCNPAESVRMAVKKVKHINKPSLFCSVIDLVLFFENAILLTYCNRKRNLCSKTKYHAGRQNFVLKDEIRG